MERILSYNLKKFGNKLKQLRKAKGFSQLDIEIETGIDRTEISRMERDLRNMEFNTILKFAKALDVPLKDLFDYDN